MVHTPIKGYRELSKEELAHINELKELAEQVGNAVRLLEGPPLANGVSADQRWLSIGRTHLQQGFMAVIRSIAKPTTF